MYQSEMLRVRRIEGILEKIAYSSVLLDALVALGTYAVISRPSGYSSLFLMVSNYLVLIEVALAAVIFASLIAMRHYNRILTHFDKVIFRARYGRRA